MGMLLQPFLSQRHVDILEPANSKLTIHEPLQVNDYHGMVINMTCQTGDCEPKHGARAVSEWLRADGKGHNLDYDLTRLQVAEVVAFESMLESQIRPAINRYVWLDPQYVGKDSQQRAVSTQNDFTSFRIIGSCLVVNLGSMLSVLFWCVWLSVVFWRSM
jgi:hypothetical protein